MLKCSQPCIWKGLAMIKVKHLYDFIFILCNQIVTKCFSHMQKSIREKLCSSNLWCYFWIFLWMIWSDYQAAEMNQILTILTWTTEGMKSFLSLGKMAQLPARQIFLCIYIYFLQYTIVNIYLYLVLFLIKKCDFTKHCNRMDIVYKLTHKSSRMVMWPPFLQVIAYIYYQVYLMYQIKFELLLIIILMWTLCYLIFK